MSSRQNIPLYRDHGLPRDRQLGANAGLWYNKMVSTWKLDFQNPPHDPLPGTDKEDWRRTWLESVAPAGPAVVGRAGDHRLLAEAVQRLSNLTAALGGVTQDLTTAGRFVTGLGLPHPIENGLTWHPTLGVPYLPGSSVKGLVRNWAEQWASPAPEAEEIRAIFGPEGEDSHVAGQVIFFDVLPTTPVQLDPEVMTPHYSGYYQDGDTAPGDWESPIPIPFLTVAAGQRFRFAVAPRTRKAAAMAARAGRWLEEVLTTIGAGAKTAVGYGRFVTDGNKQGG